MSMLEKPIDQEASHYELNVMVTIGKAFEVFKSQFSRIVLIVLLTGGLPLAFSLYLVMGYDSENAAKYLDGVPGGPASLVLSMTILDFVLSAVMMILISYLVVASLRHTDVQTKEMLSYGMARILPALGVAVAVGIATAAGTILLVIPGIIIYIMYSVAIPVNVVEKSGVFASLNRSAALTKGSRWQIAGVFIIATLILILPALALSFLMSAIPESDVGFVVVALINFVYDSLVTAYLAVISGVLYYILRVKNEYEASLQEQNTVTNSAPE